jgi:hypothetical protein
MSQTIPQMSRACIGPRRPLDIVIRRFDNPLQLTYDDLLGVNEVTITGAEESNSPIDMPTHPAMLQLFRSPHVGDVLSIIFNNWSEFSIDLVTADPGQTVTIGAGTIVELYLEVLDATPVLGVANVRMTAELIGSSGTSAQRGAVSTGQHATDIRNLIQTSSAPSMGTNFQLGEVLTHLQLLAIVPPLPAARSITFTNNTSSAVSLFLTVGAPAAAPIALLSTLAVSASLVWPVPAVVGWNGNFTVWPLVVAATQGFNPSLGTVIEFGLNQFWSFPGVLQLRDTWDVSTVPPGLGSSGANGPRSLVVELSIEAGYSQQQAYGYSVGTLITPPINAAVAPDFIPQPVVTTCAQLDGNCAQSITFPNDTAAPKQQTGYADGSYTVSLIAPTV